MRRIAERDAKQPFAFVVTPNVDHLVRLEHDTVLATLYAQAWLTVCDSRILELIGRISGEKIDVAPGSDLTAQLFDNVIDPAETITIIGGSQDVIDRVSARYGLTDVRWHEPPMGLRRNPEAVAECAKFVADNPARFVFICVGSPQQEMIAEACLDRGDCTGVGLCVGASLDFLGGKAQRAPRWMQKARLEWLHRLAMEPQRMWRRYLVEARKSSISGGAGARPRPNCVSWKNISPNLDRCVSALCTSVSAIWKASWATACSADRRFSDCNFPTS